MNGKELDYVRSKVENEGFHYCFTCYSDFPEIKDEAFHKLRETYVEAAQQLADYLGVDV